jgi:hypothetical protein
VTGNPPLKTDYLFYSGVQPNIVLADPPWQYNNGTAHPGDNIETKYATCPVAEICTHRPETARDAVLFLWATAPLLLEGLQVMDAWGFRYKTNAVWDKEVIGLGYWSGSPGAFIGRSQRERPTEDLTRQFHLPRTSYPEQHQT